MAARGRAPASGSGPCRALPSQSVAEADALLAHLLLGRRGGVPHAGVEAGGAPRRPPLPHLTAAQHLVSLRLLGTGVHEPAELVARRREVTPRVLDQSQVLVPEAELRIGGDGGPEVLQ